MGRELQPVVMQLGEWGMRWARRALEEKDLDVDLLMLYPQRSINPEALPGKETVIRFRFSDLKLLSDWWLLVNDGSIDLCAQDPGRDVDIYLGTDLRTMIQVWMGDLSYRSAVAEGRMTLVGPSVLTRDIKRWLAPHPLADIRPAREIV